MTRSGAHRDDLGIVGRLEHPGDEHVLSMPLRTPALKGSDLSGPFRHRRLQLLLARDMQHAVIVLDHIANGLQVALDEAGDDLALEAAVFALLDDPLADDELLGFVRSSGCLLAALGGLVLSIPRALST